MPPMISGTPQTGSPSFTDFDALSDLAPSPLDHVGSSLSDEKDYPSRSSDLNYRLHRRKLRSPLRTQQADSSSKSCSIIQAIFDYNITLSGSQPTSLNSTSRKDKDDVVVLDASGPEYLEYDKDVADDPEYQALARSIESKGHDLLSLLVFPRSKYQGHRAPLPMVDERTAIHDLLQPSLENGANIPGFTRSFPQLSNDEYVEFDLTDFVIYLPHKRFKGHRSGEMRGLQFLATKQNNSSYLFDGILRSGSEYRYVEGVPFKFCPIGNYGTDHHDVGSNIWIKSDLNVRSELYYRLKNPAHEYKRYHDGFLWIANLGKHFVDYCERGEAPVSVWNFRSDFSAWLKRKYWHSEDFQSWYRQLGSDDFRRAVTVNINFLFKEAIGVSEKLRRNPIWSELLETESLDYVPKQEIVEEETIVTQFVYDLFKHLKFGHNLKVVHASRSSESKQVRQENRLGLTTNEEFAHRKQEPSPVRFVSKSSRSSTATPLPRPSSEAYTVRSRMIASIRVGDVIATHTDCESSNWKNESSKYKSADDTWLFYVQGVRIGKTGKRQFDILWLYRPSDTSCGRMKYPFLKELFLSNHCECLHEEPDKRRIPEDDVIGIVPVKWNCHPSEAGKSFFIRQTFLDCERFVTLKESHKNCEHLTPHKPTTDPFKHYPVGQTVLARPPRETSERQLEVYEIDNYYDDGGEQYATLRLLKRRVDVDGNGKPNELVYTNEKYTFSVDTIYSKCLLRFYSEEEARNNTIPAPYSRDGTGNAFYITSRLQESDLGFSLIAFDNNYPQSLRQGFDPAIPIKKPLRGLDLYCGIGGLGFGLEEGGAIRNEWAVDFKKQAIHTYSANLKHPANLFFGSVNDFLSQALTGNPKNSKLIPLPEDVDFISAGSPCQGFSIINSARNNEKGLKNQSMVASVASYIDFYRPKYGLLENVLNMARSDAGRDEDVLAQLMCAIVAMGYQARIFLVDAWSCGGSQKRSRIFVSFTAPGLEPVDHPALSHSHPPETKGRKLGKLANGQPFSCREHEPTPFKYVSAYEATKDLPAIGDGATYQSTRQPEHAMGHTTSNKRRLQLSAIPRLPRGMSFSIAWKNGLMTPAQRLFFPSAYNEKGKLRENVSGTSQAWQRVHPEELFSTMVSNVGPEDSRAGRVLHWDEQRLLTTMEGRRMQGMPDDEVLLGNPLEGWVLLGNSVSRQASLALGLALREAWEKSNNYTPPPWAASVPHLTTVKQTASSVIIPGRPKVAAMNVTSSSTSERLIQPESSKPRLPAQAVVPVETNAIGHFTHPKSLTIRPTAGPQSQASMTEQRRASSDEIPDSDADSDIEIVSETVIRRSPSKEMLHQDNNPPMSSSESSSSRKRTHAATKEHHTADSHKTKAPRMSMLSIPGPSHTRKEDEDEVALKDWSKSTPPARSTLRTSQTARSTPQSSKKVLRKEPEYDAGAEADFDSGSELMEFSEKARYLQTKKGKVRIVQAIRNVKRVKYSSSASQSRISTPSFSMPSASQTKPDAPTSSMPERRKSSISVVVRTKIVKTNVINLVSDSEDSREVTITTPRKPQHKGKSSQTSAKKPHSKPYVSPWPKHDPYMEGNSHENEKEPSNRLPHDFATIRPPPQKYVPAKNDFMDPYQQTNSSINRQSYGFGSKSG